MIIKLKTRKNIYTAKQLVRYVLTDKGKIEHPLSPPLILQNISRLKVSEMHLDYLDNHKFLKKRKGATALYHEIISIHPDDRKHVTKTMLQDLMRTYVSMRGVRNGIVIAQSHSDSENQHIHFMISANEYRSSKRLYMSQKQMRQLLVDFENYHKKKYPQLEHSIVHTIRDRKVSRDIQSENRNSRRESEQHMLTRIKGKKLSKKQLIFHKVELLLGQNMRLEELVDRIKSQTDLEIYSYRGKIKGVIAFDRKWRFETLGISLEKRKELDQYHSRLKELALIREMAKSRGDRGRSRG